MDPKKQQPRRVTALTLDREGNIVFDKEHKDKTYELEVSLRPGTNEQIFNISRKIGLSRAKKNIFFTCPLSGSQAALADMVMCMFSVDGGKDFSLVDKHCLEEPIKSQRDVVLAETRKFTHKSNVKSKPWYEGATYYRAFPMVK